MPTLQAIRRQLMDELDGQDFGFNFTASSNASTAVTTADPRLRDSRLAVNQYEHAWIFRPGLTGADRIKPAGDLASATGVLDQLGSSWVNTADTNFELLALHPDVLHNLVNDALELELTDWESVLTPGPALQLQDADMESSDTWGTVTDTSVSNIGTNAKNTDAAEVWSGQRSSRWITNAAGGYAQSSLLRVRSSTTLTYWAVLKADGGTARLRLVDQDGTSIDSITTTEEQWTFLRRTVTVGSGVEGVRLRFIGDANLDEIDVDLFGIQPYGERIYRLPSWADERFKIAALAFLTFTDGLSGSDTWNANSRRVNRMTEGVDWRYINNPQAANTLLIEILNRDALQHPLVVIGKRPWSDFQTLTLDTDSTNCTLHVIVRRIKFLLGVRYPERFPGLAREALQEVRASEAARRTQRPEPPNWTLRRVH